MDDEPKIDDRFENVREYREYRVRLHQAWRVIARCCASLRNPHTRAILRRIVTT